MTATIAPRKPRAAATLAQRLARHADNLDSRVVRNGGHGPVPLVPGENEEAIMEALATVCRFLAAKEPQP